MKLCDDSFELRATYKNWRNSPTWKKRGWNIKWLCLFLFCTRSVLIFLHTESCPDIFCTQSALIFRTFLCWIKASGGHWGFYLAYCRGGGRGAEQKIWFLLSKIPQHQHLDAEAAKNFSPSTLAHSWFLERHFCKSGPNQCIALRKTLFWTFLLKIM